MRSVIAYIIYILIGCFVGFICSIEDIDVKSWKYWGIIGSVIGAYLCGKYGFM